jgi:hypothetical protein
MIPLIHGTIPVRRVRSLVPGLYGLVLGLLVAVLQGTSRFLSMNAIIIAQPIVQFGLLAAGMALGDVDTTNAVLYWSGGTFAATLLALALLGRPALRLPGPLPVERTGLREQVRFGLRGQIGNVMQLLNYRLDQYIVLLFVNTRSLPIFFYPFLYLLWRFFSTTWLGNCHVPSYIFERYSSSSQVF